MKTGVQVVDAMTKSPVYVEPQISIKECSKVMLKNKVGSILVKKGEKILGIVTEKDIVRSIADNIDVTKTKVEDIMTVHLISIDPGKDLYEAINIMRKNNVRRLPVMDNGKLIGLLTEKDILKIQPELFDLIKEKYKIEEPTIKSSEKYLEGECENCGNYGQLYQDPKGSLVCYECLDEESAL